MIFIYVLIYALCVSRFASIAGYLYCITKYKGMGCKLAVRLNNSQAHVSSEAAADSLIYKVLPNSRILDSLNIVACMVL